MWPVPMAMRSFAVPLVGASRGPRRGVAGVAAYLAEAALDPPVLAGGEASVLGGPTSGYLLGLLPAAVTVGRAAQKDRTRRGWPAPFGARLLGARPFGRTLMYRPGLTRPHAAWLHDLWATLAAGLLPPPLGDALKPSLAAGSLRLRHGAASRHHPHG